MDGARFLVDRKAGWLIEPLLDRIAVLVAALTWREETPSRNASLAVDSDVDGGGTSSG